MNNEIKRNKSIYLLIAVALETLIAVFVASHIYYRKPIGIIIIGIVMFLTALLSTRFSSNNTKLGKLFAILLGADGLTVFFGAVLRRATIMEYALIIAVVIGVIYLIVSIVKVIKHKVGKIQIGVSVVCMVTVLCSLVLFGNRMITSAVTAVGAEAYDNSVDFGISGQWITIDREDGDSIRAIINLPRTTLENNLPAVVFTHGGSWVGGTAMEYDGYCQTLADDLGAVVINVDYRLLFDKTFPSPVDEAIDTVHYLYEHAEEYDVDKDKIFVHGESAGGHIAACAAVVLTEENFPLRGAMYHYPFATFTARPEDVDMAQGFDMLTAAFAKDVDLTVPELSPGAAPVEILKKHCPVFLEIGTNDILKDQGELMAKHYEECGVDITVIRLEGATHAFLPVDPNNREEIVLQKNLEDQCRSALKEFFFTQINK